MLLVMADFMVWMLFFMFIYRLGTQVKMQMIWFSIVFKIGCGYFEIFDEIRLIFKWFHLNISKLFFETL